ncbi:hypothetical protein CYMTET_8803 [Cymbomonas tetramitiformis]|uniref:Uncharacterized protein n=1 Tax=Cymbomonas tetramitiformis TaxID=36881 RepID=A0AAE0LG47_9CHLO|nr:hypothetical protein CYMTET_8803 [Cymbomonas tetramitiformis]
MVEEQRGDWVQEDVATEVGGVVAEVVVVAIKVAAGAGVAVAGWRWRWGEEEVVEVGMMVTAGEGEMTIVPLTEEGGRPLDALNVAAPANA